MPKPHPEDPLANTVTKFAQRVLHGPTSGTKLTLHTPSHRMCGTKLSQRTPKRRFWPTFRTQGELCTVSATNNPSRAKKVTHQHPTAPQQRTPLQISHAIRLPELATKPRNVAIPTITIQISKHSQGNCLRNEGCRSGGHRRVRRARESTGETCHGANERLQRQPRQNSHIISYGHFWRPSTNVAIATTPIHDLKYPQGNYVRNC